MKKSILMIILIPLTLCLSGCEIENKEYFGEDTDNKLLQAYSNREDYILEVFDNKEVTAKVVESYDDYDTSGPINMGVFTTMELTSNERNSTGSSNVIDSKTKFIWPVSVKGTITSTFGGRASPGGIGSTNHKGIDIAVPVGTSVIASASGTITVAQWENASNHAQGYGLWVEVDHGNGKTTRYGHNSKLKVAVGDKVNQGDVIALSGNSGASTGPHCHFEIREKGVAKNPLNYVKKP